MLGSIELILIESGASDDSYYTVMSYTQSEPTASHPFYLWRNVHIPAWQCTERATQRKFFLSRHALVVIPPWLLLYATAQSLMGRLIGRAAETSILSKSVRGISLWPQNHRASCSTAACSTACVCSWKRWPLWACVVVLWITLS